MFRTKITSIKNQSGVYEKLFNDKIIKLYPEGFHNLYVDYIIIMYTICTNSAIMA